MEPSEDHPDNPAKEAKASDKSRRTPNTPLTVAFVLIAGAVVLLVVVMTTVLKAPDTSAPRPLDKASPPGSPATTLDVTTTPGATLSIDDSPMGQGSFHGSYPRDGLAHRIKAEEPGYMPHTEIVVFDKPSVQVDVSLNKIPPLVPSTLLSGMPPSPPPMHKPPPPWARSGHPPTAPSAGQKPPTRPADTSGH